MARSSSHAAKAPPLHIRRQPLQPPQIVPFHAGLPKESASAFMAWPYFLFEKMLNPWQPRPAISWMDSWRPESRQASSGAKSRETEEAYIYTIELPDVRRDQIALSVQNGVLMLKVEEASPAVKGRRSRYLRRAFSLPFYTNAAAITAQLQNGMLTIIMPKTDKPLPARSHIIPIREKETI